MKFPAACVAAALAGVLSACGSTSSSGATCDDYAKHDKIARALLVSDAMRLHDLNVVDIRLHRKIDDVIEKHCGEHLDPKGNVKAARNNTSSFDATVNWSALRSASTAPMPTSPTP
jgi:hypothetical protein